MNKDCVLNDTFCAKEERPCAFYMTCQQAVDAEGKPRELKAKRGILHFNETRNEVAK